MGNEEVARRIAQVMAIGAAWCVMVFGVGFALWVALHFVPASWWVEYRAIEPVSPAYRVGERPLMYSDRVYHESPHRVDWLDILECTRDGGFNWWRVNQYQSWIIRPDLTMPGRPWFYDVPLPRRTAGATCRLRTTVCVTVALAAQTCDHPILSGTFDVLTSKP